MDCLLQPSCTQKKTYMSMYERKLSHNLKLKSTLVQLWKFCLPVMTHFYICCTRLFPAGGSALRDSTLTLMVVTFRQNKMHTFFIESISSSYERLLHSYEGIFFFFICTTGVSSFEVHPGNSEKKQHNHFVVPFRKR